MKLGRPTSKSLTWRRLNRVSYEFQYSVWNSRDGFVATIFRWTGKGDPLIWGVRLDKSEGVAFFATESEALASVGYAEPAQ